MEGLLREEMLVKFNNIALDYRNGLLKVLSLGSSLYWILFNCKHFFNFLALGYSGEVVC